MVASLNALASRVVDRIVDQVECWLAVDVDANRGGRDNRSLHLNLQVVEEAGPLSGSRESHVLAFARFEGSYSKVFALTADGTLGRHEHKTRARSICVKTSQVRGVTVPPDFFL